MQDEDDNEESMFKDDKRGKKVEDKKKTKEGDIFSSFLDEGDDEGGLFGSAEDVSTLETATSLPCIWTLRYLCSTISHCFGLLEHQKERGRNKEGWQGS